MIEDDGWGRETRLIPSNMLYVYRQDDPRAISYTTTIRGSSHHGRLFIHDTCDGQRRTYAADHVNQLLLSPENPDGIKERIVELIPRLSSEQKQWLAKGISSDARDIIRAINSETALLLQTISTRIIPAATSELLPK